MHNLISFSVHQMFNRSLQLHFGLPFRKLVLNPSIVVYECGIKQFFLNLKLLSLFKILKSLKS